MRESSAVRMCAHRRSGRSSLMSMRALGSRDTRHIILHVRVPSERSVKRSCHVDRQAAASALRAPLRLNTTRPPSASRPQASLLIHGRRITDHDHDGSSWA